MNELRVALIDDKFFAYIPKEFLNLSNLGIDISMNKNLHWISPLDD